MLNRLTRSTSVPASRIALRRAFVLALFAVLAAHGSDLPAQGGRRGGGGGGNSMLGLVQRESVQAELKLTEEQIARIKEFSDAQRAARAQNGFGRGFNQDQTEEERAQAMAELRKVAEEQRKVSEARLKEILSPEQFGRALQLTLQSAGPAAFQRGEVLAELKLTDAQKAEITKLQDDAAKAQRDMFASGQGFGQGGREAREKQQAELKEKLLAVLTADQKKQWEAKLGPPPVDAAKPDETKTESAKAEAGSTTTTVTNSDKPAAPRLPAIEPEHPKEAPVVAEFSDAPNDGKANDGKPGADQPGEKPADGERRFSFNFRFAPWVEVLTKFAKEADMSLDMTVVPPGTFNYFDKQKYTAVEALDVLNGYLLPKGYLLLYRDRFLVVWNIDNPIPPNLIPKVDVEDLPNRGKNELLTVVLTVEPEAVGIIDTIKELLGPQGKLVTVAKSNTIVVTDIGSNLRQIHKLLSTAGAVKKGENEGGFRSFQLKHIAATDAERTVRDLFGLPPRGRVTATPAAAAPQPTFPSMSRGDGRGGRSDRWSQWQQMQQMQMQQQQAAAATTTAAATPAAANAGQKMQVSAVVHTNSLLVTASAADLDIVEKVILSIDVGEDENGRPFNKASNTPQLEVYSLVNVDIQVVINAINVILPGLQITEDPKGRRITVYATPDEQSQVRAIVRQLDSEGGATLVVISLKKLDPTGAVTMLKSLFTKPNESAPNIEADPQGRRLMVNGTTEQVMKIKGFLKELGEDGNAPTDADLLSGGPVRTIPLNGRDARQLVAELERMWPSHERNPIRVVTPSAISPIRKAPSPAAESPSSTPPASSRSAPTQLEPSNKPSAKASPKNSISDKSESAERSESKAADDAEPVSTARDGDKKSVPCGDDEQKPETSEDKPTSPQDPAPADKPSQAEPPQATAPAETTEKPQSDSDDSAQPNASAAGSPVNVTVVGNNLIISSDDIAALNRLERMIQSLSQNAANRPQWTVFNLQAMDCVEAATLLGQLIPTSSVSKVEDSGSLMGSLTGGITSLGSNLLDMTGMNNLSGGTPVLRIIPEPRSNSLLVSGTEDQIQQITEFLRVLDSGDVPDNLKDRIPRSIELQYADVLQVKEIVEDVFKEQLTPSNPLAAAGGRNNGQQQPQLNPLALLMGGAAAGNQRGAGVKMTLGVDQRANTLIVSASDSLFKQVKLMVEAIDQSALDAQRTVQVITLKNANSQVVQQALTSLVGKVRVSSTSSANRQTNPNPNVPQIPFQPFVPSVQTTPSAPTAAGTDSDRADRAARFMQRMQEFQQGGGGGRRRER